MDIATDTAQRIPAALQRRIESRDDAEAHVHGICFKIGPPRLVGLELERLVHDRHDPSASIARDRLLNAVQPWYPAGALLPSGSTLTVEPGGQVEISTAPVAELADLVRLATGDTATLTTALLRSDLCLADDALDRVRPPRRMLDTPRYAAMQSYFDRCGTAGRTMMCSTASVQPCLDAGTETGPDSHRERWRALHELGPVLVAMFANSPLCVGRRTGWRSSRQAAWLGIDPARTRAPAGTDPRASYARFALDAPLLCVRDTDRPWAVPRGITFADWIAGALPTPPSYDDLDYHLSTLFPPVRAQGHLEIRYLDAQRGDDWRVVAAVVWALLSGARVRDTARAAAAPTVGRWVVAARDGLADPALQRAARVVVALAIDALSGQPAQVVEPACAFAERYTLRGRCPADDIDNRRAERT